jgi:retinol dehydrogenase 12
LFTELLTPLLIKTAKISDTASVRVAWLSSSAADMVSPKGGVDMSNVTYQIDKSAWHKYSASKAGNYLYAAEYAKKHKSDGIVSVVRKLRSW